MRRGSARAEESSRRLGGPGPLQRPALCRGGTGPEGAAGCDAVRMPGRSGGTPALVRGGTGRAGADGPGGRFLWNKNGQGGWEFLLSSAGGRRAAAERSEAVGRQSDDRVEPLLRSGGDGGGPRHDVGFALELDF